MHAIAPQRATGTLSPRAAPTRPTPAEPADRASSRNPLLHLLHRAPGTAVQRRPAASAAGTGGGLAPTVGAAIHAARGGGRALDAAGRAPAEAALGERFAGVRIHADARSDALARGLGARAFTTGSDIFFRAGTYAPATADGRRLLAHELAHVAQQAGSGEAPGAPLELGAPDDALEREADGAADAIASGAAPAATGGASLALALAPPRRVQRAPDDPPTATGTTPPTTATPTPGTPADAHAYFSNPTAETDTSLQAALNLFARYKPEVDIATVEFRMAATAQPSTLGGDLVEGGWSHWEDAKGKKKAVIELLQPDLDTVAAHVRDPASVPKDQVYDVIRTVGHELHHLWRGAKGDVANPIKPVFDVESDKRMQTMRDAWLERLKDPKSSDRAGLGIAPTVVITKWEDVPKAAQTQLVTELSATDPIAGLYRRSAYLVEETYTKIEELSYLRVEQKDPDAEVVKASRGRVAELAKIIRRLDVELDNAAQGGELLTPELVTKARTEILAQLRKRFPGKDAAFDSFEVIFYLAAREFGLAPIYSDGKLISKVPADARMPPAPATVP